MHLDTVAYHAARAPAERLTCEALAHAIERNLPEADDEVRHHHPVWSLDGNPIVGYAKLKDRVRLLFWSGRSSGEDGLTPEGSFQAAEARRCAREAESSCIP